MFALKAQGLFGIRQVDSIVNCPGGDRANDLINAFVRPKTKGIQVASLGKQLAGFPVIPQLPMASAKLEGEFVWHHHDDEDEMFLVVKGRLLIRLRDRDIWLDEGEFVIIPHGVEHLPVAEEEAHVMLFERKSTRHTGNMQSDRTVTDLERI